VLFFTLNFSSNLAIRAEVTRISSKDVKVSCDHCRIDADLGARRGGSFIWERKAASRQHTFENDSDAWVDAQYFANLDVEAGEVFDVVPLSRQ
jgi:hypothetical protein